MLVGALRNCGWLVSIVTPGLPRYLLWGAAMVTDLIVPIRAWAALPEGSVVILHLTERFGTFFTIVLGESILAVVASLARALVIGFPIALPDRSGNITRVSLSVKFGGRLSKMRSLIGSIRQARL